MKKELLDGQSIEGSDDFHLIDGKYAIKDLIDIDRLRSLFEELSGVTGISTGFVSYPEQELLIATGWRNICRNFHLECEDAALHCKESRLNLTIQCNNLNELNIRACGLGLVEGATPVFIMGRHAGSLFTGPVLLEKPDIKRFKKQAEIYGFEQKDYLDALGDVPVITEEQLKKELLFLSGITSLVVEQGLNNLKIEEGARILKEEVTERKRAEKQLRTEHDKFIGVLNVMGEGLYIVNRDFVIEYQNKIIENSFGNNIGRRCYKTFFGSEGPCDFCPVIDTVISGKMHQVEAGLRNGKTYDVNASPFTDVDGNVKAIVLLKDITKKKTLQAEAMRAGHLASLGELAAGVAHEINNPINGVINYAEILKDEYEEKGEDNDIPSRIIKEGERIAVIVSNLLSFARDRTEDYSHAYLSEILSDTLSLVEKQIMKDRIELNLDVPHDLPAVKVRTQEIQQVILNLLSNGRHALNQKFPQAHDNKQLEITGETIAIEGLPHVRMTFHDHGIGIPAAILEKICNPFFSTKPKGEGTGLGLSISHGIIKNHGGKLSFESVEGEYTKVIIDLPLTSGSDV